jgi:hypothetical protein
MFVQALLLAHSSHGAACMHAAMSGTWTHGTGWRHSTENILRSSADRNDKDPTISAIYFVVSAVIFGDNHRNGSSTRPPACAAHGGALRCDTTGTVGGRGSLYHETCGAVREGKQWRKTQHSPD